jgi:type I restriction enzyme M protein
MGAVLGDLNDFACELAHADFVLANLPFNDSDWGGEHLRQDVRWKYGVPPVGNTNFARVQHFIYREKSV